MLLQEEAASVIVNSLDLNEKHLTKLLRMRQKLLNFENPALRVT